MIGIRYIIRSMRDFREISRENTGERIDFLL